MKHEVKVTRTYCLEMSEDEAEALLGHLEDDMEIAGPYWEEGRGVHIAVLTKALREMWRRHHDHAPHDHAPNNYEESPDPNWMNP